MTSKTESKNGCDLFDVIIDIIWKMIEQVGKAIWYVLSLGVKKVRVKYEQSKNHYRMEPITEKQVRCTKTSDNREAFGYSVNRGKDIFGSEMNGHHIGIWGPSQTGKTVALYNLINDRMRENKSFIFIDPKTSKQAVVEFAQRAWNESMPLVFSPCTESSIGLNPLAEGTPYEICERIMLSLEWGNEPFYKNESELELRKVLKRMHDTGRYINVANLFEELEKSPNRKNISGLLTQLGKLNDSEYGRLINRTKCIGFDDIRANSERLYIGVNTMSPSGPGVILLRLFQQCLVDHTKRVFNGLASGIRNPKEQTLTVFIDELGSFANDEFLALLNKARSSGLQLVYSTQSIADLGAINNSFCQRVFDNTPTCLFFRPQANESVEYVARLIGTITQTKKTHVTENDDITSKGSMREVEEFVVHPSVLKMLRVGQAIYISQNDHRRVDLVNVRESHFNGFKRLRTDLPDVNESADIF